MRSRRALPILLAALLLAPLAGLAQIPDQFTNLKVLPSDTSKAQLVATMRGWAGGLGVRCNHCHVGPDNLQGMDFAADTKPQKLAAREMLRMVQAIQGTYLKALPAHEGGRQEVSCFTCHRGQPKPPRPLSEILIEVVDKEGAEAGLARFREMQAKEGDAGLYDFRERSLTLVASHFADRGKLDDALLIQRANLERYPKSTGLHCGLGEILLLKGDRAAAHASFQKALELDPASAWAQSGVARSAPEEQP